MAAAAAGVVLWLTLGRAPESLSYVLGDSRETGKVGAWIASPPGGLPLRFSDGTEILLQPGASARISRADSHGADVLLERGALHAGVVHRDAATAWTVRAGPFEIRVIGTSFDAAWDSGEGALDVRVEEGRVIVLGPLLDDGRAVQSDERLHVSLKDSRFEMTKSRTPYTAASNAAATDAESPAGDRAVAPPAAPAAPSASPTAASPGQSAGIQDGSAPRAPSPAPASSATATVATSAAVTALGWRDLARAGQHRAALDLALAQGYEGVLSGASGADLLLLADSARYAGDATRARKALLAARGRGVKGSTAFLLGKLAADASGAPSEGAQWFSTYLQEAPSGALAEQALGRLIELHRRTGQSAAAATAAAKYLQKYPGGGYASMAKAALTP